MNNNNQDNFYACPSFNAYSSDRLAQTALRVAVENSGSAVDDEDFEFALVSDGKEVLAEELLSRGQIGPIFPVFNRDLLVTEDGEGEVNSIEEIAVPLSKLFIEEDNERDRDYPDPSCSSSEADDLDHIPAGTYCVWRPKLLSESPAPNQCKKSKSTGSSSRRWKLRDLMKRCNSDGKDSFVFLTPKQRSPKLMDSSKGKSAGGGSPSAHEAFYVRNRAKKEDEKKKSYLPYRQNLVGVFGNVNGLRRGFPHL